MRNKCETKIDSGLHTKNVWVLFFMHFQFHTVDPERPLIYLILFKHMEHDLLCNIEAGLNKASGLFSER